MADFMTVLAASQKQTLGGKQTNPLAGLLPEGLFGSVLSARLDAPLDEAITLALPVAVDAGIAVQAGSEDKKAPLVTATDTGAPVEAQAVLFPLVADRSGGKDAGNDTGKGEEARPIIPAGLQSTTLAASSAAAKGMPGQELPVAGRMPPPVDAEMAVPQGVAGTAAETPLLAAGADMPLEKLPATELTGANAARQLGHVGQFEQGVRAPESRLQVALEAPVRSQAFPSEFSEKIVWLAGRQSQWADMSLNPPQLGAIEVRLSLSGGEAGAQFYSPHPAVRDAIEAALPKLRELMAQAGIALGDAQVREEAFARRESGGTNQNGGNAANGEASFPVTPLAVSTRAGLGLVDLYV